jgi:hypothetical protein
MPDNVISQLSYDQFIDLLAFLKSRGAQESLRGSVLEYSVATGFAPNLSKREALEKKPDPAAKAAGSADGWHAKTVGPDGRLDLASVLPDGWSAAYALTFVYSPTKQRATLELTAEDAVRVDVGGETVFAGRVPFIPYSKKTEAKIPVQLVRGWNPILVKLVTTGKEHRLGLHIDGDGLRTASRPDAK